MSGPADQSLPRTARLTRSSHFKEAFDQPHVAVGRLMVARLRVADDANLRIGIIASRKVGPAVDRSLARRRLREAWRRNRHRLKPGQDVLLVARRPLVQASADEVERELIRLMGSLNVISAGRESGAG